MAEVIGLDSASQGQFTAADLAAYKARGLSYIELYEKWATPELVTLIRSEGLGIAPLFESTADRALAGYNAGGVDAKAFLAAVPAKFGIASLPTMVAVGIAVDFDATAQQQPTVLDYLRGFKEWLRGALRTSVYGNGAIGVAAKQAGVVDFDWTAGGMGMRGTKAVVTAGTEDERQDVGDKENLGGRFSIDSDVAVNPDLSWIWWPDGDPRQQPVPLVSAPTVTGAPAPIATQASVTPISVLPNLKAAQAQLGVTVDGIWGEHTAAAFAKFYSDAAS